MCGLPAHALDLVVFTGEDSVLIYTRDLCLYPALAGWLMNMSNSQSRSGTSFRVITGNQGQVLANIVQNSTCHQPPGVSQPYTHSIII